MRASSVDQVILATFAEEPTHLTSREIYRRIRKHLPAVNQSTVYRSLDRMVKRGEISVSDMGTGSAVYELVTDDIHHHMVCQSCGKIVTLDHEEVGGFFENLETTTGFEVATNHLVLFGVCPECREAPNQDPNPSTRTWATQR